MPTLTCTLLKFQKPPLSLKQFMLRSEVLKLYRGFMKLGRLIDTPPPPTAAAGVHAPQSSACNETINNSSIKKGRHHLHPLQLEWNHWVRSEFRLRQDTDDEDVVRMMLAHGRRQLQEMERTILLATNRNANNTPDSSNSNKEISNENDKTEQPHKSK